MKKKIYFILFLIFSISLFLNIYNIWLGMPNKESVLLVFNNKENIKQLSPYLLESRNKVYSNYKEQKKSELLKNYFPEKEIIKIKYKNKNLNIEEEKLHSLRSVLLQNRFPDEQKTLCALSRIKPKELKFNPGIYQYGGLYFFISGLSLQISKILGLVHITNDINFYFLNTKDSALLYIIPKIMGAFLASCSVIIIFFIMYSFFNLKMAFFSSLFMALNPAISVESHYLKPFAMFLPFFLFSLYFSFSLLKSEKKYKSLFLASFFAGLSSGIMLFSSIVLLSVFLSYIYRIKEKKENFKLKDILLIFFYFSLSFLIVNPYYIFSFKECFDEINYVGSMHEFKVSLYHIFYYSFFEFYSLISWPLTIFVFLGVFFSYYYKDNIFKIITIPFLVFYFYTSNAHWDAPHYSMSLIPYSAILASFAIYKLGERLKWNLLYNLILFFSFLFAFLNSVYYKIVFSDNQKNILQTGKWINENIKKGSNIGTSIYPYFGFKSYPPFEIMEYKINEKENPKYYIINDIDFVWKSFKLSFKDEKIDDKNLQDNYILIKEFKRKINILDLFYSNKLYRLFEQDFKIYERKN